MRFIEVVYGNIFSFFLLSIMNILMVAIFLKWRFLPEKMHLCKTIICIMTIILTESIIGAAFYKAGIFHWKYNIGVIMMEYITLAANMFTLRQLYGESWQSSWMATIFLSTIDTFATEFVNIFIPDVFFDLNVLSERLLYFFYLWGIIPIIEIIIIFLFKKISMGRIIRHWIDMANLHFKSIILLSLYPVLIKGIQLLIDTIEKVCDKNAMISLIMLFIVYIFFMYIRRKELQNQKLELQQVNLQQQNAYIDSLENLQKEMRRFQHDYKNMMSGMYLQAKEGNMETIQNFIQDMTIDFDNQVGGQIHIMTQLGNVHMPEIKGLLLSKLEQMQKENIDCNLEVMYPFQNTCFRSTDLCRCLGILIDNAIDEVSGKEKPQIHIIISCQKNYTTFQVKNKLYSKIDFHKIWLEGYSTKGTDRGIGLANYKKILERYENISSLTTIQEGYFIQELKIQEK